MGDGNRSIHTCDVSSGDQNARVASDLLEQFGIFVNTDCVIRKAFCKYLHPKEAYIGNGILNKELVRVAKGEAK